jgi:4-amino-4-deoxy-L-arabinose transferase-like glycosyltransferase
VWIAILLIVLAAGVIRSVDLGRNPPGFFVDEAFTGYDAYSIAKTGRDLWGERMPVFFRSWGDYNSGLYRYLSVPWVAALGLSEAAVRATAAFVGALTVLLAFLIGRRLFSAKVGLVAAALLAISPWHFQFSRIAFRGILLPCFLVLAAFLFLKAVEKRGAWFVAAAAAFGVCLYTYSPARIIVPAMIVFLLVRHRRRLRSAWKVLAVSLVVFLVLSVPLANLTLSGKGQQRYEIMSIFRGAPEEVQGAPGEVPGAAGEAPGAAGEAPGAAGEAGLLSGPARAIGVFARNYASHFSPRFLLTRGDVNLRHSPTGIGQLNWAEFALFAAGIVLALWRRKEAHVLLLFWILIAPVPGSLTTDNVPNALRAIGFLPAVQLLAATAVVELLDGAWLERPAYRRAIQWALAAVLIVVAALGVVRHLGTYYGQYKIDAAPWWDYGYRQAITFCEKDPAAFRAVAIVAPDQMLMTTYSNNPFAYAFPLFYARLDPATVQKTGRPGRYAVIDPPVGRGITDEMLEPGVLYVLRPSHVVRVMPLEIVNYPSGDPALVIAARAGRSGGGSGGREDR